MTVKEIASLAGVSAGTVDRVLHKRGRISKETRSRVEAVIEKYQWTPNLIARHLKRGASWRFTVFIPRRDQDAGYWGQALDGVTRAADNILPLGAHTEIVEFDRYDDAAFNAAADRIIHERPDGVVFAPIKPVKTRAFVERMEAAGIPFVYFDTEIPDTFPLAVIGHDSWRGGYLGGRLMQLLAPDCGAPVAVLNVYGEDYHILRRRDGFLRYAAEHGIKTVIKEYSGRAMTEFSEDEVAAFLEANPHFSGVFITNCLAEVVAGGAALVHQRPIIVGYDLTPGNFLLLRKGGIDAIISQRPENQGRAALTCLYRKLVLEQEIPSREEIPLDIYLKENAPEAADPA
jgi:LacI family transcriptional regulator